jgi:hypothetical protein
LRFETGFFTALFAFSETARWASLIGDSPAVWRKADQVRLTSGEFAAQVEDATADSKSLFNFTHDKEIDMTTSKPIELGRASDETKDPGSFVSDHPLVPNGEPIL